MRNNKFKEAATIFYERIGCALLVRHIAFIILIVLQLSFSGIGKRSYFNTHFVRVIRFAHNVIFLFLHKFLMNNQ